MKNIIIIIILFSICMISCTNFMEEDFAPEYPDLPAGVNSIESAFLFTSSTIEYISDNGERWQGSKETLMRGTGDCEDFAILFGSLCRELGHNARVIVADGHAVAKIDGILYDCVPILIEGGQKPSPFEPDTTNYQDISYDEDIDDVLYRCWVKYESK